MEYIDKYSMKEKIGAALLSMILLFGTASSAMAVSNVTKPNYKTTGDVWWYSLANTPNTDVGAWNRTDYFNPTRQHCTKLKSDGAWRVQVVASAGKHAHDEAMNHRAIPYGTNKAVAGLGNCVTLYAPKAETNTSSQYQSSDSAEITNGNNYFSNSISGEQ